MATVATTSYGMSESGSLCAQTPFDLGNYEPVPSAECVSVRNGVKNADSSAHTDLNCMCEEMKTDSKQEDAFDKFQAVDAHADLESGYWQTAINDEFYDKFRQLKESNQRTMEELTNLHRESYGPSEEQIDTSLSAPGRGSSPTMVHQNSEFDERCAKDMAEKPLCQESDKNSQIQPTPTESFGLPCHSVSEKCSVGLALNRRQEHRRAYSLDDKQWQEAMQSLHSHNEASTKPLLDSKLPAAVSCIRDMWQSFKIDDYAPGKERNTSAPLLKKKREKQAKASASCQKITIPKPFQMLEREANRVKKKTKAQLELDEKLLQKQREEEEECQKKFKAQPAPAHIYLPLYSEILENSEVRRHHRREHSKEVLKSKEKPFSFIQREENKKQHSTFSAGTAERTAGSAEKEKDKGYQFVAQPVPRCITNTAQRNKFLEEEEIRKIRINKRAQKMLKKSALPPNMANKAESQKMQEQKEKQNTKKVKSKRSNKRNSRSSHHVPDYGSLYHEFQKELAYRKTDREATVMEPFSLEARMLCSAYHGRLLGMEKEEKIMRESLRDEEQAPHPIKLDDDRTLLEQYEKDLTDMGERLKKYKTWHSSSKAEEENFKNAARTTGHEEDSLHTCSSATNPLHSDYEDVDEDAGNATFTKFSCQEMEKEPTS